MGKAGVACLVAAGVALAGSTARAQSKRYQAQPLNLHREKGGAEGLGELARARAKKGDCAGAIEAFDAALRTSDDPALRRDRGRCHEALGDAFPAIDDYRAYLTAAPDAPDSDDVRERLASLEQASLGYSSASTDAPDDVRASASATNGGARAGRGRRESPVSTDEDDRLRTPVRKGRGFSVSPFFSEHKWGTSPGLAALSPGAGASFGDSGSWSESVGAQLRFSLGPTAALFAEAGFEHFNSTAIDGAVVSGLTSQLGYELRFPLDRAYDGQIIVAVGLGYEHLSVSPGDGQTTGALLGAWVPRGRFGWRRLLAPSAGLELSLDGGAANFFEYGSFPFDANAGITYLVAANVGLIWGL